MERDLACIGALLYKGCVQTGCEWCGEMACGRIYRIERASRHIKFCLRVMSVPNFWCGGDHDAFRELKCGLFWCRGGEGACAFTSLSKWERGGVSSLH